MHLMLDFQRMRDPRGGQGRRYPLPVVMTLLVMALLSKATSLRAMSRWMAHHRVQLNQLLGLTWKSTPTEGCLRHMLARLSAKDFDSVLRSSYGTQGNLLQVDGKALRGRLKQHESFSYLCSVFQGVDEVVLAQTLHGPGHELSCAQALLEELDLTGSWVSFDALHTQKKQ